MWLLDQHLLLVTLAGERQSESRLAVLPVDLCADDLYGRSRVLGSVEGCFKSEENSAYCMLGIVMHSFCMSSLFKVKDTAVFVLFLVSDFVF